MMKGYQKEEMLALEQNATQDLVVLPLKKKAVGYW